MVRIWPPTSCSHASSAGNGTGLRRHQHRVNPWMDSAHKAIFSPMLSGRKHCLWCWWDPMARPQQTAGSISPPMHNCHVLLCSQYSRVYLFLLKLYLLHCNVQYCNVQYLVFLLVVVKTCPLWNWIKKVNMKDCSVLYKVDQCVAADLKVYSYDASVFHFDIRVPFLQRIVRFR